MDTPSPGQHGKSEKQANPPKAVVKPQENAPVSSGKTPSTPVKGGSTTHSEARLADLTETLQRLQAEFENYQKRTAREKAQWQLAEKARLITGFLPVLEALENGAAHAQDKDREGLNALVRQTAQWLRSEGVEPMESLGKPFDPQSHDCVLQGFDPKKPEHIVLEELQKGYWIGDTVLRHAKVKVNLKPAPDAQKKKAADDIDAKTV
ncbi:MAG: nucleotide exchange factor GrpE [Candidatus Diapherotrites archaeon]|nr:nucleotide exchange factor GrpE [Candidatus Diapherotrites archaeon]